MIFLLIIYLIFLAAYLIYSAIAIYHLWRFGYVGDLTKLAIIIYVIISVLIIVFTLILIAPGLGQMILAYKAE